MLAVGNIDFACVYMYFVELNKLFRLCSGCRTGSGELVAELEVRMSHV